MPGGSDAASWTARVVALRDVTAREHAAWDRLCRAQPPLPCAFFSYTYARAVASVRPHVFVLILERDGEGPAGFLPFQFSGAWTRLLAAAEPVGGLLSDYFGLVAEPDAQLVPGELLRRAGLGSLLFTHLDETQRAHGLVGEQPDTGLRIDLTEGPEEYWAAQRRTDKRQMADSDRRKRRLIAEFGPLRFALHAAEPRAALEALIAAKRAQYARTGVGDPLAPPWTRALLHTLAASTDPLCTGVMSELHAGETWVASHFGLRCEDTLHYWFPVYNPALRTFAPGRQLENALILDAPAAGLRIIDRGAGDTPAKRLFANRSHQYYRGLWSRPTARSLCFRLAMSVRWRVLDAARARRAAQPRGADGGDGGSSGPS